jgi:predicted Rossmann fold nucleotide-binding protein DprA/Smf involved in DNA uptake
MKEEQFDLPFEPRKLARNADPHTSKEAAKQAGELRSQHHRKILASLRLNSGIPYEIAMRSGLEPAAVFRRLSELERAGKIYTDGERIGPTGRKCRVWKSVGRWSSKELGA